MADPLNKFTKEIKTISSKKKKTDVDLERLAELEFKGSLYVNEQKQPILPSEGIEAMVVSGAKCNKQGKDAKAAVFCPASSILEYDGPKDIDELWKEDKFRLTAGVKVKQARIMRTRPIFPEWSADIELRYNTGLCNESQIDKWLKDCGEQCGAFDWRPRYGRFEVSKIK